MNALRRQLPVYSPLSLRGVWGAALHVVRSRDARQAAVQLLRDEYAADHAVLCGSGTQALQLALQVASRQLGGSPVVALPAFTCYDVGTAAVGAGLRAMLYDVDPGTLGPDFDSLRHVLQNGARVVVVSPLYGVPVDWDAVDDCVAPYGAIAIEDAAQGHGAIWRGRPLGSLGKVSVLSFSRGKGWTGIRGGALLLRHRTEEGEDRAARDPGIVAELKILTAAILQWALGRPRLYWLPASIPWLGLGETIYKDPSPVEAVTSSAAALVMHAHEASAAEAAARRSNAASLLQNLRLGPRVRLVRAHVDSTPGYLRLPLRLSKGLAGLAQPGKAMRLGIAPSYPTTLAALPQVRARMSGSGGRWAGGEELSQELVTLPTHSKLGARERAEVLRVLNTYSA
jgi:perosamine synthetase